MTSNFVGKVQPKRRADYPSQIIVHAIDVKVGDVLFTHNQLSRQDGVEVIRIDKHEPFDFLEFVGRDEYRGGEKNITGYSHNPNAYVIVRRTRDDMVD